MVGMLVSSTSCRLVAQALRGGYVSSTYLYIMVLVVGLFAYMDGVMLYVVHQTVAKQATVDLGRAFLAGLFLFFGLLGNVIGKVRRNFYIGVRVPWTLASDRVWNDTHRLAAWVWVAAGVIGFAMIVLGAPDHGRVRRAHRVGVHPRDLLIRAL